MDESMDRFRREQVAQFTQRYDAMAKAYEQAVDASLKSQQKKIPIARPLSKTPLRRMQQLCGQALIQMGGWLLPDDNAEQQVVILVDAEERFAEKDWCTPRYSLVPEIVEESVGEDDDQSK